MADEQKIPELEIACPECKGECGWVHERNTYVDCHTCDNDGVVITEFGEKVLEFVGKHFGRMLRANING